MEVDDRGSAVMTRCGEPREQLLVDAAEAAIAHDQHVIAGLGSRGDRGDQRVEIIVHDGLRAERRERRGASQPSFAA